MAKRTDKQCLGALGLAPGVSFEDARKAYRSLAMRFHPDRNPSKEAEERFKDVQTAYDQLSERSKQDRWEESWDQGPREKASAGRERAYAEPAWPDMRFDYLDQGSLEEIGRAFFRSFMREAGRVAQAPWASRAGGVAGLLKGYRKLFELYGFKDSIPTHQLGMLTINAQREFWNAQMPGSFDVVEAVANKATASMGEAFGEAITARFTRRSSGLMGSFNIFEAIAEGPDAGARAIKFHEEMAREFSDFGPCEEQEADWRSSEGFDAPFAVNLARSRPKIFEIYAKAGWIEVDSPIYRQEWGVDLPKILLESEVAWDFKGPLLWKAFGAQGCADLIGRLDPQKGREVCDLWAGELLREGAQVEPSRRGPLFAAAKEAEARFERAGRRGWLRGLGWGEPSVGERAFEAAKNGDMAAFEVALSDARSEGSGVEGLSRQGVRLATYLAWGERFGEGDRWADMAKALAGVFGSAALKAPDESGISHARWREALGTRAEWEKRAEQADFERQKSERAQSDAEKSARAKSPYGKKGPKA